VINLYKTMLRIRLFEEKVAEFVENRTALTPCHLYIGQEAIATGVCAALKNSDVIWGNHRSHGHFIAKGGSIDKLMAEILCREDGVSNGRGGSMHVISQENGIMGTVPIVAATIPLAVGSALASQIRNDKKVTVAFFGDGATEEGHFHESVNLAALYKLPVLFVCENNYYASHLSMKERRPDNNLHEFGNVYRINSVVEDGNDIDKVIKVTEEAVQKARNGEGPSFLEFTTYRWKGHVGHRSDMDVGVMRKDELQEWLPKDPISRLKNKMMANGQSLQSIETAEKEINDEIQRAVEYAMNSPFPDVQDVNNHVFYAEEKAL
jgi:acetoin:2,6-dichlorophenolindophenol oxidoreductase subunit alpha